MSKVVAIAANVGRQEIRVVLSSTFEHQHPADIVLERGRLTVCESLSVVRLLTHPALGERWQ